MSDSLKNARAKVWQSARRSMGRREFLGSALGAAVVTQVGAAVEKTSPQTYKEDLETPVVGRYQVVVAGGVPAGSSPPRPPPEAGRHAADRAVSLPRRQRHGGTDDLLQRLSQPAAARGPADGQGHPGRVYRGDCAAGRHRRRRSVSQKQARRGQAAICPTASAFDPEAAKIASLNLLKKEGVTLRLHSWVVGADAGRFPRHGRDRGVQIGPAGHRGGYRHRRHGRRRHRRARRGTVHESRRARRPHGHEPDVPSGRAARQHGRTLRRHSAWRPRRQVGSRLRRRWTGR